jgi:1-deoxy-D-xylulose-5-phosphate reductoisomerase
MKTITVLGSTGSIGTNTLDVVRRNPRKYAIHALAAGQNVSELTSQIVEFRPKAAVVATSSDLDRLTARLETTSLVRSEWPELGWGDAGRIAAATAPEVDTVISAIVGVTGLNATYEAIRKGKRVGLANKEVLVSAGKLVMQAVREYGAELVPVDSEHNGAHQCLRAGNRSAVSRLILTASGGPFRNTPAEALRSVTPAQALRHPTWRMGNRITIDCATLMNKGFEVIEACWLFDLPPSQIDVVVHPQSSVHAMIEYHDGSVLAQISATDMRMPIQYALSYPERDQAPVPKIDWSQARQWEFLPPDFAKFPLLKLAYRCQEAGGSATCTLNAADEVAVQAFLEGQIPFTGIYEVVEETLARMPARSPQSISDILNIDAESRALARELVVARAAGAVTA